jgi:hypothetical protein
MCRLKGKKEEKLSRELESWSIPRGSWHFNAAKCATSPESDPDKGEGKCLALEKWLVRHCPGVRGPGPNWEVGMWVLEL